MSNPIPAYTSIVDQLGEALQHLRRAQDILVDIDSINYKVLGDFNSIREFVKEEIAYENG